MTATINVKRVVAVIRDSYQSLTPEVLLALGLTSVPIVLLVTFIFIYNQNLLAIDSFRLFELVRLATEGRPFVAELFAPHSYHITVPTGILFVILTRYFHLNVTLGLYVNFLFALAGFVLLLLLAKRRDILRAAPLLSVLYFSVTQDVNWLNTYIGHWLVAFFFVVLTLYLMQLEKGWAFPVSLASGLIATFSMASGFLVWPATFLIMLRDHRKSWWKVAAWVVLGVVSSLAYIYLSGSLAASSSFASPVRTVEMFLTQLGAPFTSRLYVGSYFSLFALARLIGVLGLALMAVNAVFIVRHVRDFPLAEWGGLLGFVLLGVALIALKNGTSEIWEYAAFWPWYQSQMIWFWVIVALSGYVAVSEAKPGSLLPLLNIGTMSVLLVVFVMQNASISTTSIARNFVDNPGGTPLTEDCARATVYELSDCGLPLDIMIFEASYGYGVFHGMQPHSLLADADAPIIIDVAQEWQAVALRDWILAGSSFEYVLVEEEAPFEISPDPIRIDAPQIEFPDLFWYVCTPEQCDDLADYEIEDSIELSQYVAIRKFQIRR